MAQFRLFVDSSTGIDIDPEYDMKLSGLKIEDVHRTLGGVEYRYKWGDYDRVEFSLQWVNSSTMAIVNSWWSSNTNLQFMETDVAGTELNVRLVNKTKPIDRYIKPYTDMFMGKIQLETYV